MPTETPTPQHLTLRFKKHKTTVLLLVSPHESLTDVKAKLLDAIISTGVAYINGPRLPSEPEDVILGVPIDSNDPSQGWMDLEIPELDDGGGKKAKKPSVLNATPFGAGLSDGMALAFRFRRKGDGDDGMDTDENQWDVVLPAYDDEADSQANDGEENGQDAS